MTNSEALEARIRAQKAEERYERQTKKAGLIMGIIGLLCLLVVALLTQACSGTTGPGQDGNGAAFPSFTIIQAGGSGFIEASLGNVALYFETRHMALDPASGEAVTISQPSEGEPPETPDDWVYCHVVTVAVGQWVLSGSVPTPGTDHVACSAKYGAAQIPPIGAAPVPAPAPSRPPAN